MSVVNILLFIVLPYISLAIFLIGSIYKYNKLMYKYSSLSSQFVEGDTLFWGIIPFHWGMVILFAGHLIAFLIPSTLLAWNSDPVRLLILEGSGIIFALNVLGGLILLFARRLINTRVFAITNRMDILLYIILITQVILGIWVAVYFRWGSSWFASVLTPYLWSLITFTPSINSIIELPMIIQLHILGFYFILLLFPFTRLVHMLVAPFHYIPRKYQQVMWTWDSKTVRSKDNTWTEQRPYNN